MRHDPEGESLTAMKARLRDLENTKLIYLDDLSIVRLRRELRAKVTELEKRQALAEPEVQAVAAD